MILHTYRYKGRGDSTQLHEVADEVYFYDRNVSAAYLLSDKPFIVRSRTDSELLQRLSASAPDDIILFEGLHTTAFLGHPALKEHFKIVRAHNVEHDYYMGLSKATASLHKKVFFYTEAKKLRRYEKQLKHADSIITLSESDTAYFAKKFGKDKIHTINCFYNDDEEERHALTEAEQTLIPERPFMLYHGNLSVDENIQAAKYILSEVLPRIAGDAPLVVAGLDPGDELRQAVAEAGVRVTLVSNPSDALIDTLIERAAVNLLFTFQATGIKLKLLNCLRRAHGHILANSEMANDSRLAPLCTVRDTADSQAAACIEMLTTPVEDEETHRRQEVLDEHFSAAAGAKKIMEIAFCVQ